MLWLLILILVQVAIAGAVIFVLKRLLDRELVQAALERLHAVAVAAGTGDVVVKHCGVLSSQVQGQIQSIVRSKSPQAKVIFQEDAALRGGLAVQLPGEFIDFSLAARLKNFWQ